jgi:hypothetical protein
MKSDIAKVKIFPMPNKIGRFKQYFKGYLFWLTNG